MNRVLQCVLLTIVGLVAVAAIPGIRVTDRIVPSSTNDTYPTHEAQYGRGGWRSVSTLADRDAIPTARREAGMIVWVDASRAPYALLPGLTNWARIGQGTLDLTLWGAIGDGQTDCSDALEAAQAVTNHLHIPPGRYRITRPMRFPSANPVTIRSEIGSFQGDWISSNEVAEAEFVYDGPSTNIAFDFMPDMQGGDRPIRYGLVLENVSFNANGRADIAVRLGSVGRGRATGLRANGATGVNILLDQVQFTTFNNCSTSINDERPSTVHPRFGLSLTNYSPANLFLNCQIENSTEFGVLMGPLARNNVFMGGAIESNEGGGVRLMATADRNIFDGVWFEANGGTNWIQLDASTFFNSFRGIICENDLGTLHVAGSYNLFDDCVFGSIHITSSGTRNKWRNVVYGLASTFTDESSGGNAFQDLIRADAQWRTNTFSSPIVLYGDYFKLWNGADPYPMAQLLYDRIAWGDGQSPPSAVLQMLGTNTIGTPNELRITRDEVSDVAISILRTNEPYVRAVVDAESIAFGSGLAPRDSRWHRAGVSNLLTEAKVSISRGSSPNDDALLVYPEGALYAPFKIVSDGRLIFQPTNAPGTAEISGAASNVLRLKEAIELPLLTIPPAAPVSGGRFWILHDGSKHRFVVKWPDGSTNVLAVQP